ncbi:MAG: 2-phospho-L-lactate transferase CofD family protein, partial [Solibacillus sp.]
LGETIHYTASQHIEAIHAHVGQPFIEALLINDKKLPPSIYENYREENAEPVQFDVDKLEAMGIKVIQKEIAIIQNGVVRHDAKNLADWLCEYANCK